MVERQEEFEVECGALRERRRAVPIRPRALGWRRTSLFYLALLPSLVLRSPCSLNINTKRQPRLGHDVPDDYDRDRLDLETIYPRTPQPCPWPNGADFVPDSSSSCSLDRGLLAIPDLCSPAAKRSIWPRYATVDR